MIRRTAGFLENGVGEAHLVQIKGIDESIDETDGVLLGDVIIKSFRKEDHLIPAETFDMLHSVPRSRQRGGLSLLSH